MPEYPVFTGLRELFRYSEPVVFPPLFLYFFSAEFSEKSVLLQRTFLRVFFPLDFIKITFFRQYDVHKQHLYV